MIQVNFAKAILNYAFRGDDIYVGLLDDDGDEITGYDGDRKLVEFDEPVAVEGKQTVANSSLVDFEEMPECVVDALRLCDADDEGNALLDIPLIDDKGDPVVVPVLEGQTLRISAGMLTIDLAAEDKVEEEEE